MNKRNIFIFVGTILGLIFILILFWKLKFEDLSMPVQHRIGIKNNSLDLITGMVREIRIKGKSGEEKVDIEIRIYDNEAKLIWKKIYTECNYENDLCILESFTKENPLELPIDGCRVEYSLNGTMENYGQLYFIEYNASFQRVYFVLCLLVVCITIVVLYLNSKKSISLSRVYFILMIIIGMLYNFVLPPLSVPDEQAHFLESYKISSILLGNEVYDSNGRQLIRPTDYDAMEYLHNIASIAGWYNSFELISNIDNEMVSSAYRSTVATKAPHAYFVPAIVISIARILNLSGNLLLILGRYSNLILFSAIVALAIKLMPYGKNFFFIIGLLPETIYLFTSYSYDGLNLALCMLIIAFFMHLYYGSKDIGFNDILVLGILILLMIPIKVVYIVYGLLIFLLPKEKLEISKRQVGIIFLVAFIGIGGYGIANFDGILGTIGGINRVAEYEYNDPITLGYIIDNWSLTIKTYLNTIFGSTSFYMDEALGAIVGKNRFSDNLGYRLPSWIRTIIYIFILVGLEDSCQNKLPLWKKITVLVMGSLMYLLVLTSMYFACTKVGNTSIGGVQGRYMLPIVILLPLMLKNRYFTINVDKQKMCVIGMGMINVLFAFLTFFFYSNNYFG